MPGHSTLVRLLAVVGFAALLGGWASISWTEPGIGCSRSSRTE